MSDKRFSETAAHNESNLEFIERMFATHGPLAQMMIIDAICDKVARIAESSPEDYPPNDFINWESWVMVARRLNADCEAKYGRH